MSIIHQDYVGRTLDNGAIVLCQEQDIVLAYWIKSNKDLEFITWSVDNERNAYWGDYFSNIRDAIKSFDRRSKNKEIK